MHVHVRRWANYPQVSTCLFLDTTARSLPPLTYRGWWFCDTD